MPIKQNNLQQLLWPGRVWQLRSYFFLKKGNTEALLREILFYTFTQMERLCLIQCNGEHLHVPPELLVLSMVPQGKPNRCTDSSALSPLDISAQTSSTKRFQTFIQDNRSQGFLLPNNLSNILDYIKDSSSYTFATFCSNSFVTISTERNKAIPPHNSFDANVNFQIHPARSSIQKSLSCAAHSSSGQGEHTPAPGFQFLHEHSMPQAWKSVFSPWVTPPFQHQSPQLIPASR